MQPVTFSNISDITELNGENYKILKERILLHLGCMIIDYAIRKHEPYIAKTSTPVEISLHEQWERSNRLSTMFIKTKIIASIRGSVEQYTNVKELMKVIDEQFETSDKALISTLIMKFSSMNSLV
ncbi:uncharacterized protein LOC142180982 [Nicotiana tabacum]|uniref:Uncharacterized protein LOC142180982 n=1 Tax=Nicotiana tabacum TaxID=4097 RepID=A0AC58UI65_TOBAC